MKLLRIMLIADTPKRFASLERALQSIDHSVVARLTAGEDIALQGRSADPEIILSHIEQLDCDMLERLRPVTQDWPKPIVVFTERSDSDTTQAAIQAGVTAYVVDKPNPNRLRSILEVAMARFQELQNLRKELDITRAKLAERKVIEKAKGLLMQKQNMTEEQAYQALRSLAMNRGQRLAEVAEAVVSVMELLIDPDNIAPS